MILEADGKASATVKDLHNYIGSKKPGDTIRLNVWSQGMKKFVAIKLGETPAGPAAVHSSSRSSNSSSPKGSNPKNSSPKRQPSRKDDRRALQPAGPPSLF